MRIEFVDGPHDGLQLSSGLGAPFLWTDGKRCFRAPAVGRALYRTMQGLGVSSHYRFIGHTHGLCVCGALRKRRPKRCKMCGKDEFVG